MFRISFKKNLCMDERFSERTYFHILHNLQISILKGKAILRISFTKNLCAFWEGRQELNDTPLPNLDSLASRLVWIIWVKGEKMKFWNETIPIKILFLLCDSFSAIRVLTFKGSLLTSKRILFLVTEFAHYCISLKLPI